MPDGEKQASLTGPGQGTQPGYSRTSRELASLIPSAPTTTPIPTIHEATAGPSWMEQWDAAVASGQIPPAMVKHVQRQAAGGQVDAWKIAGWVRQAQPYLKHWAPGSEEHVPSVTDVPTGAEVFEAAPGVVDFPVAYAAEFPGVSVTEDVPVTHVADFPDVSVTEDVGIPGITATYGDPLAVSGYEWPERPSGVVLSYGGPRTGVERRVDFESSAGFVMFTSDPWAPGVGFGPGAGVGLMPDPEKESEVPGLGVLLYHLLVLARLGKTARTDRPAERRKIRQILLFLSGLTPKQLAAALNEIVRFWLSSLLNDRQFGPRAEWLFVRLINLAILAIINNLKQKLVNLKKDEKASLTTADQSLLRTALGILESLMSDLAQRAAKRKGLWFWRGEGGALVRLLAKLLKEMRDMGAEIPQELLLRIAKLQALFPTEYGSSWWRLMWDTFFWDVLGFLSDDSRKKLFFYLENLRKGAHPEQEKTYLAYQWKLVGGLVEPPWVPEGWTRDPKNEEPTLPPPLRRR